MTDEIGTDSAAMAKARKTEPAARLSLLERFVKFLTRTPEGALITATSAPLRLSETVRLAFDGDPFMLTLGDAALEFHQDLTITGDDPEGAREWIVRPRHRFDDDVAKFIRIRPGETLLLGRADDLQTRLFGFDRSVADRHVRIASRKGELTIKPLERDQPTSLREAPPDTAPWKTRRETLMRLPDVIGHSLKPFDDDQALDVIRDVNHIMADEAYREPDDQGAPGGIIRIPDEMTVVILGDIHTRADNILRVITDGVLLAALEQNDACLVFLGDLVHSDERGKLEDMSSSVFILDFFCMLKRRFPRNIFYTRGNHESFSPDVGKGGVPQGLLLRKHLKKRRGKTYASEIETLFDSLAFVVQNSTFAACHGAPVRTKVDHHTLVNIRRYPGIQYELVWNRLRQSNRPVGYGKGSIKRFRQTLNLPKLAPVIVAHTPLSQTETLWQDVGDIKGHHVVYSAHAHRVGALVMSEGQVTPLEFIPEPALAFLGDEPAPPDTAAASSPQEP